MIEPRFYFVISLIDGKVPGKIQDRKMRMILFDHPHGLLRRDPPLNFLMSALCFLGRGLHPHHLERWLDRPLRDHFPEARMGELFVDSGGFYFVRNSKLDLSRYGIPPDRMPEGILDWQIRMGADVVANMDWPIPPGLDPDEAKRRQELTLDSALRTARLLAEMPPNRRPRALACVHGIDPADLEAFTRRTIAALKAEGLLDVYEGVAVGGLVPRRKMWKNVEVVALIRAARRAIPDHFKLHAFGVAREIIPYLIREGATSFDSTFYLQEALFLNFITPDTRRKIRLMEMADMDKYPCSCVFCVGHSPKEDAAVMANKKRGDKSEVVARLALHTAQLEIDFFREVLEAWRAGAIDELIRSMPDRFPFARLPCRDGVSLSLPLSFPAQPVQRYDLRSSGWQPDPRKDILILMPCSKEKPYTRSDSFMRLWSALQRAIGSGIDRVQVVFISGLHGPVPMEHALWPQVKQYDFHLTKEDEESINRVASQIWEFWTMFGGRFKMKLAMMYSPPYRIAVKRGSKGIDVEVFRHWSQLRLLVERVQNFLSQNSKGG